MGDIELMLIGKLEMSEFIRRINTDQTLQTAINNLVPMNAIDNTQHPFWKLFSFESMKRNNYNLLQFINWMCRFDDSLGDNLNVFSVICKAYLYTHPDFICTKKYEQSFSLYLDIAGSCYEGPEVRNVIAEIVQDALLQSSKKKQIAYGKEEIQKQFHITGKKKPRWIQGPEWPMGSNSPMRFVSQLRKNESVQFLFEDVDTHATRVIEQYY